MADFLSDEWIAQLGLACPGAAETDASGADRLVIEPVVRGVPARGEVRYRIAFDAGGCAVTGAGEDASDVRLETDYVTAVALSRGAANAQAALADGRLRVSGDVSKLARHASALARLDDLFAAVRATTTYPAPDQRS